MVRATWGRAGAGSTTRRRGRGPAPGRALAVITSGLLLLAACGGRQDETGQAQQPQGAGGSTQSSPASATGPDPGITDTEIRLGSSYAFSGPQSVTSNVGRAVEAYWKYVNEEKGGIRSADGKTRKVVWTVYDDAYLPPRAVENAKRLVEQDKVFALFNPLGTPTNSAIHDYMNQQRVPHALVYSGADKFYADVRGHPWTIGWQVPYPTEATVYAEFLKQNRPNAKVAVLSQNDDFGRDYLRGFESAIKGSGIQIVARQSYQATDPSVDTQVTTLAQSGADVFFLAAVQKPSSQALKRAYELSWKPLILISNVAAAINATFKPAGLEAARGVYSGAYYKDPSDPQWADDPAMLDYKARMGKYCAGNGCNPEDALPISGFTVAEIMEKAIERMATPTRQGLMDSLRGMQDVPISLLLPGIRVTTGPDDGYPIEAMQMQQFDGTTLRVQGDVIDVTGRRGG